MKIKKFAGTTIIIYAIIATAVNFNFLPFLHFGSLGNYFWNPPATLLGPTIGQIIAGIGLGEATWLLGIFIIDAATWIANGILTITYTIILLIIATILIKN
jgi:hypothetical protein